MRFITPAAQERLNTNYGSEPIFVIGVEWNTNSITYYADKTIYDSDNNPIILGRILSVDNIESVLNLTGTNNSASVDVKLDDSDLSLLNLMNNVDIHMRKAYLFQSFEGLALSDMILYFEGQIVSDISWNDSDKSLHFTITTALNNYEAGFSPEEGDVVDLREDLVGKAWPLVFGSVYKCPATRITDIPTGITASPMAFHDYWLDWQTIRIGGLSGSYRDIGIALLIGAGILFLNGDIEGGTEAQDEGNALLLQADELDAKVENLRGLLNQQLTYEVDHADVLTDYPMDLPIKQDGKDGIFEIGGIYVKGQLRKVGPGLARFRLKGPYDSLAFAGVNADQDQIKATFSGPTQIGIISPQTGNITDLQGAVARDLAAFRYIQSGSVVRYLGDYPVRYVINITACAIQGVYANRTFEGYTRRMVVPESYYKIITVVAQSSRQVGNRRFICTGLEFFRPLSTLLNEHWDDNEIFVNVISGIGSTFQSVIIYLVSTFTLYSVDASVSNVPNFRLNFALLELKDAMTLIQEICWQCKVGVTLKNGQFHFTYLPAKHLSSVILSLDDILEDSLSLSFLPTENLITKMIGTWREDWSDPKENRIVIRYNVAKYGTLEESHDFYCFNVQKAVEATMSFWLYRKGNSWKHLKLQLPIKYLVLETYDIITLGTDITTEYGIANGVEVPCVVESVQYDATNNILNIELELPIKLGENVIDRQYWPSGDFQWMGAGEVSQIFNNIKPPHSWNGVDDTPKALLEPIFISSVGQQDNTGGIVGVDPYQHNSLSLFKEFNFDMGTQSPASDADAPTLVRGDYGGTLGDYIGPRINFTPNNQGIEFPTIPPPKFPLLYQDPTQPAQTAPTAAVSNAYPGYVVSGKGSQYQVSIYPKGLSGAAQTVSVTILQINADDTIPAGTGLMVVATTHTEGSGDTAKTVKEYYAQVAIWMG